ncbi:PaaI family thioesterase [Candidatus Poribacteria bacterium]|nr:PaaI family thioesterase [Candidatus Poribacteria bacterium]MYA70578.1 PaaI family thioesterase [Candidatus Poribacteria bacterium]MYH79665.1 PaaI family thioesterase [Candidatus Poribacteria bacterium]MYK93105.1 PaaI family thioesterase [Candidatus Poribacteria bacterium]
MTIENNDNCFVCGMKNPFGFQVKPEIIGDGASVRIECTPAEHLQGWANILHGGILSTLLDEAITYVGIGTFDQPAVTAQLEVRFRNPAPTAVKLFVRAERTKVSKRLVEAKAAVRLSDGTLIATGTGKVVPVGENFAPKVPAQI